MLRPTYNDLIESMNRNREEGELEVQSRYSVVIASAKRARQLIDGEEPLIKGEEGLEEKEEDEEFSDMDEEEVDFGEDDYQSDSEA